MTIQDLLRQAADAKTLEAARRLFFSRRWQLLQGDGHWLWGELQVNSPKPLQAAVDMIKGQFFCNCRSRQRPCAHALSLLMILQQQAERISVASPTDWVLAYQDAQPFLPNTPISNKQASESATPALLDEKREQLMQQGLQELELRLLDIIERGLADTNALGSAFWEDTAARLTDAKLPGLANQIRFINPTEASTEVQLRLLSDFYLAIAAWKNRAQLASQQQQELNKLLGVNIKKEVLWQQPGQQDHWLVMGQIEGVEDRLRFRRVWLRGEKSRRFALLLDYAFGEQAFERSWPLASAWDGAVFYYPGAYPQRALFPYPEPGGRPYDGLVGYDSFSAMRRNYQKAIATHPWLQHYPVYLHQLQALCEADNCYLLDAEHQALPVPAGWEGFYTLLAASYQQPLSVFAEFDGYTLRPLAYFSTAGLQPV